MNYKFLQVILCLLCISFAVNAQAPNITYAAGAKNYTIGVPIQTLSPVNAGGAVPAGYYAQVTTFCGSGKPGYQDGSAAVASFKTVRSQCIDAQGNIFMADEANHVIRKITPAGVMSTFAGSEDLYQDGVGTSAGFRDPRGITIDAAGNLYVISDGRVRKITRDAVVTTIAGNDNSTAVNGTGANASFGYLISITADSKGNLYVSDLYNNAIRKITAKGVVTTFVGSLTEDGTSDGDVITARFSAIGSLCIDKQDNIIAADKDRIRKITPQGIVTTVGTAQMLGIAPNEGVGSVVTDQTGNVYYTTNHFINVVSPAGVVNRVAGTPGDYYTGGGKTDGVGTMALFKSPTGLVYDGKGNLYVVEFQNYLVRKIGVTGYIIDKPLPGGLKFDQLTGNITGFATEVTPAANYVVTAFNASGSSAYTLNITTVANKAKPVISSFSPLSGPAGTLVTIYGSNLVNTQGVAIGGINTAVISNTNTEVVAMVMPDALNGSVTLNTANGYATASNNFKLAPAYGSFVPQTKITSAQVKGLAQFGWATALSADGNTLIVGANADNNNVGAAYIYTRNGDSWSMEAKLTGLDVEGQAGQGASVAITGDGNMAIVGGNGDNNGAGAAWIYTRSGKVWTQQDKKIRLAGLQSVGSIVAVSADGSTVVVGGSSQNGYYATMAIYDRVNNSWTPTSLQLPFGFQQNNSIVISANGKVIAVGQPSYNSKGTVRVYSKLAQRGWSTIPPDELVPDSGADGSQFGSSISVSADGRYIVVGAPNFNNGQGAAWAFKRQYPLGNPWSQKYKIDLPAGDNNAGMFGRLVGTNADGSVISVGDISSTGKEELRFFKQANEQYTQQGNPVSQATNNATYYGKALSISADGSTVISGNHFDNSGVGSVATYKAILLPDANTLSAANITSQGVSLKGTVNGNGLAATVNFEYSTSADMSSAKVIPADGKSSVTTDQATVAFSAAISGLTSGSTYYYRINAVSAQGTVNGATQKFITIPGLPVIKSFSPAEGAVGTLVTITGDNLIGPKSITIGGVPALVISATGKQMSAMVMPGALQGGLTVTTPAGSASASGSFKVINTSQPNFLQQNRFYLDNTATGETDNFADTKVNISADGKTALFGAHVEGIAEQSGVWIYKRNGDSWEKQSDNLSTSKYLYFTQLSADGNTAAFISYSGLNADGWPSSTITVYKRDGEVWSKQAELKSNDPISYINALYIALSADGNTLVAGVSSARMGDGAAWVYTREGGIWTQQGAKLICQGAVNDNDQDVRVAISADGNTIALGGFNDNAYTGATWIFTRNGSGVWSQQGAKLVGTGGTERYQSQGIALSLNSDGNVLAVGGTQSSSGNADPKAWIFTRSNGSWKQQSMLLPPKDASAGSDFGATLTLSADGSVLMVGSSVDNFSHGSIWCYKRSGEAWNEVNKFNGEGGYPTSLGAALSMTPNGAMMVASAENTLSSHAFVRTYTATPILKTLDPLDINNTGATIAGTADDNGSNANILFTYWEGQKIGDGTTVNVGALTAGAGLASYKAVLKNLKPNTVYIYTISAITSSGTYNAESKYFTTSNAPVIFSFTPPLAQVGTTVAITGLNFKNVTDVSFGSTAAAKFNIVSPTLIEAVIAPGTTEGQIIVKNKDGFGLANGLKLFLTPQIDAETTVIQQGGTLYIRTPMQGDGYKYQWMKNGQKIPGATESQYGVTEPASYTVRVSVDSLSQVSSPLTVILKFVLPQNALTVTTQSLTCRGNDDGKVTVDAMYDSYKYTAHITGNGLDRSASFNKTTSFDRLTPGTYNVCITVDADKNYIQCYTVTVSQPADLAMLSTINQADNTILLSLSGGETYHVNLNGVVHNTTSSSILLPLAVGKNTLSVTTDKLCQGLIEKIINIAALRVPYPNPFGQFINVPIGKQVKKAVINIYSANGLLVFSKQISNPADTVTLQTAAIDLPGTYNLMLDTDGVKQVFKIIRK